MKLRNGKIISYIDSSKINTPTHPIKKQQNLVLIVDNEFLN